LIYIGFVGPQEDKWISEEQKYEAKEYIYMILAQGFDIIKRETIYSKWLVPEWNIKNITLVSGGCPYGGVDKWAEDIANELGIVLVIFTPEVNQWEDVIIPICDCDGVKYQRSIGYKSRNIKISKKSDYLFCVVPNVLIGFNAIPFNPKCYCKHCEIWKHPTNGGCWTLSYYQNKLHKENGNLVVIE
jgi:hypothetical protein